MPAPGATATKPAVAIHVRYPDYPHDAEALLVTKRIGAFFITKEVPPRVYTFAASQEPGEIDLPSLKEPQGEGIAFASGGQLLLVSEGGDASGMLTRIHCAFIR